MSRVAVIRVIARLNVGGPALHVMNLSEGLADAYPTLLVAGQVDATEADLSGEAVGRGVSLQILPELGRRVQPWQDLVALFKLVRLFRRHRPLLVHTHTAKAGTLGRIAAVLAGVPVRVHTFHGHVLRGYFGDAVSSLILAVERLLARATTCIVTISESQERELVEEFRLCEPERVRVVPLGLDLQRFEADRIAAVRGEFRREIGAGDDPVVTIVGRLVPIKNHELFLRMARLLADRGVRCTFAVVGGGPEEERLRELAAGLDLADRVRFLGWRSDLERIYADSDVVALTSNNEGTPVCLIEALSAGCAVVSTDVGGVRDVLEDGRLAPLAPAGDASALADAVARLLSDPAARGEIGRRGIETMPVRYGVGRLLKDVTELYDTLLRPVAGAAARISPTVETHQCTT